MRIREIWPGPLVGLAALALYGRTLAPGLTWGHFGADGGDFLAAALTGGIPHPPGYPAYEILLRAALALPGGAQNPARTGNWLSALAAACAVALLADLARRTLPAKPGRGAAACVAGLAWTASPALWSQAIITEVYALNALAVVALLWLLWRWRWQASSERGRAGGWPWLTLAGGVFGLGLGNHLSLLLLLPGALAWFWSNRCYLACVPRRAWLAVAGCLSLGIAAYLYLPWAAAGGPAINWGDPRTPARFAWLVTARAYNGLVFGLPWNWLPGRIAALAGEVVRQFWPWGALLALVGLWRLDRIDHAWWRLTLVTALTYSLYAISYDTADAYLYLIPAWAVAALWLAQGLEALMDFATRTVGGLRPEAVRYGILTLAILCLPLASILGSYAEMDLSRDHAAEDFIAGALSHAQPGSVILVATDRPTFALWYAIYGLRQGTGLIPLNVNLLAFPWYRATVAAHHPELAGILSGTEDGDLDTLLNRLSKGHQLYRAEPLPVAGNEFIERPAGPLWAISPVSRPAGSSQ